MAYIKKEYLKGKVKSIEEFTFNSVEKSGEIQKGNLLSNLIYDYDSEGNKIEEREYTTLKLLSNKKRYLYDDKGNNIELRESFPDKYFTRYMIVYD